MLPLCFPDLWLGKRLCKSCWKCNSVAVRGGAFSAKCAKADLIRSPFAIL
jgi:hypothetical protein